MTAEKVAHIVAVEPFRPFEVVLRGGETIPVARPLRALVTEDQLLVGVDEDPQTGLSSRLRRLALTDVVSVRFVGRNGAKSSK